MASSDLAVENDRLRVQIGEMERRIEEQARTSYEQEARLSSTLTEMKEQASVLQATLDVLTDGLIVADQNGRFTHFNPEAERLVGKGAVDTSPDHWSAEYGVYCLDMVTPYPTEDLPLVRAMRGAVVDRQESFMRHAGVPAGIWLQSSARPIQAESGELCGAVVVFHDISERKRWEAQMEVQIAIERERNDAIERLRSDVLSLSTPILEIWDDVLALPVIGILDSRRSAEIMERLLQAVEEKQCRFVIIDITGVEVVDSATADRLLKLVGAVEILGARCVLTGARGTVAQTLVSIGASLGSLLSLRNLKQGLKECLRLMEEQERPPEARRRLRRNVALSR